MLNGTSNLPWLCGGDFNELLLDSEKKGGADKKSSSIQMFRDTINNCNLQDLGFTGYPFTWSNGREGEENIQERLDRFLATKNWKNLYPCVKITHEARMFSDHNPILVEFETYLGDNHQKRKDVQI